ncbi:MAG: Mrp/NBP35 family ATP-binding protein [Micrococcaceae bacterium]
MTDLSDVTARARARLASVIDPELRRPITELGMLGEVTATESGDGTVLRVEVRLTVAGCPLRGTIHDDVTAALAGLDGVARVDVVLNVMTPEQRAALKEQLTAGRPANPFGPDTLTRIFAVASGKGGVGKSTVTANLAAGFAARGYSVGLIDADIHGFSIPGLLGIDQAPTRVEGMILPPVAHGIKVISIGMFLDTDQPVAWRGPMLHRALEQFVTDVYWGDLDLLFIDLPPGTGDIAISAAQLLPAAELLVVTTPQHAAAQVAARAGQLSSQTQQPVAGVIENMAAMTLPDGTVLDLFGSGGGEQVADRLTETLGSPVSLLGSVPLDPVLRADGDAGTPAVLAHPEAPAAVSLDRVVAALAGRGRGLTGRSLPFSPR